MTQRIFDIENEKDMADLWDILPDDVVRIYLEQIECFELPRCMADFSDKSKDFFTKYIKINWHDKTEIKRPIQEATEADVGKLCVFWDDERFLYFGILDKIENYNKENWYRYRGSIFPHCRRLIKQEIEELI